MYVALGVFAKYWSILKGFVSHYPWWTVFLVLAVLGGGYRYYQSVNKESEISYATVKRGTVSQVVSVTGTVRPAEAVDLSFEKSGKIVAVYHDVGDHVYAGAALVAINSGDISAELAQAEASQKAAEAKLTELKKGARPEDLNISEIAVSNAKNDVVNDIKNGFVNSDDAIRNKVDQLMTNPKSTSPRLNFSVNDQQLETDIESNRPTMEATLNAWATGIAKLAATQDLAQPTSEAKTSLILVQVYLGKIALAVNSLTVGSAPAITQATIDGYKSAIATARVNVTTALDSLTASDEKLKNAESALALKKAGTVLEQVQAQEAAVEGAGANILNLKAQLAKTVLSSPINGLVTKQDAKVGEIAPVATPLVSVITLARYEIEANIPEADIAKVKIGDVADVTLDAYGSDVLFSAVVTKINPAETVIDGVSTYKTKLQFKESDPRVKSGMTANTDIFGLRSADTLFIPGRAVTANGTTKTVNMLVGATTTPVIITTGLRGSNGDVEVLSGLKEGDRVKIK